MTSGPATLDEKAGLYEGVVDGLDVDDVRAAVLGCPGVAGLGSGTFAELATYLPGRRVAGVRVSPELVELEVCATWNVPVQQVGEQIWAALAPIVTDRPTQITIVDVAPPVTERLALETAAGVESEKT